MLKWLSFLMVFATNERLSEAQHIDEIFRQMGLEVRSFQPFFFSTTLHKKLRIPEAYCD